MDTMQDKRIVDGYLFGSEEDAELARQEKKKIEYLEKHMNYQMPENVLRVYKKALAERIFKTPVGCDYLKRMQVYLRKCGVVDEEEIPPVILHSSYTARMRQSYSPARQRIRPSEEKKPVWPAISVILNIILAIGVASMFWIAIKSDNPNILNYETQIVNKYASWEQELTERERIVREKEKALEADTWTD